ncbi:MAG: AAA family ATPase [Oscillospiraceae bacterium]
MNALSNKRFLAGNAQGTGQRAGGDDHRAPLKDALAGFQRLAIACAIFSGRRILILDEPTSGLDGQNMRLVAERLRGEARNGRTILVLTHDRELIESCCDNVVEVEKRSP